MLRRSSSSAASVQKGLGCRDRRRPKELHKPPPLLKSSAREGKLWLLRCWLLGRLPDFQANLIQAGNLQSRARHTTIADSERQALRRSTSHPRRGALRT